MPCLLPGLLPGISALLVQLQHCVSFSTPLLGIGAHVSDHWRTDAFLAARRYLASGGADALVSLWDLDSGVCARTFARQDNPVRSVSFSPDSRHLAVASEDYVIDVFNVATGEKLWEHNLRCE